MPSLPSLKLAVAALLVAIVPLTATPSVAASPGKPCLAAALNAANAIIAEWTARAGAADVDGLARLYADNAVLTASEQGEEHRGPAAIAAELATLLSRHPMGHVSEAMAAGDCDSVSSSGRILLRVAGQRKGTRMLLAGRYRIALVRRGDDWLIARHDLVLHPRANRVARAAGR
jgi:ketosteroid isomerase-like protein